MAVENGKVGAAVEGKGWGLCRMPFFGGGGAGGSSSLNSSSAYSLTQQQHRPSGQGQTEAGRRGSGGSSVASVAKALLPTRRRLRLDPTAKIYFPCEFVSFGSFSADLFAPPLKVYFFPLSPTLRTLAFGATVGDGFVCMRSVLSFDEPGKQVRSAIKIKNTSKSHVAFKQLEKLKRQLAEADAALEARKKPPEDTGPRIVGEGLVIDEWKERRERYLARQQVEGVDSV
ncbi:hypothetical protein BHE74_00002672 [Ensete ventricosum]|nr:hypothetical protein GW17_00020810 [Ensete ventricosum]RWW88451.1 hypothetical protein BHE74_00002672 [Ensete ventricosum]RZR93146.1 hypothetical protein BHM03_00021570 [Ensete ventricosum]